MRKLEIFIPDGIGVSSGKIYDSFNRSSKQVDIIIYEKNHAIVFPYDEDFLYINCESVIAAGEIKTNLDSTKLVEALENVKSIKNLERKKVKNNHFRRYGEKMTMSTSPDIYNEREYIMDNIFTFIYADDIITTIRNIGKKSKEIIEEKYKLFNCIGSNKQGTFIFGNSDSTGNLKRTNKVSEINSLVQISTNSFQFLISEIKNHINTGRTVSVIGLDKVYFGIEDSFDTVESVNY